MKSKDIYKKQTLDNSFFKELGFEDYLNEIHSIQNNLIAIKFVLYDK